MKKEVERSTKSGDDLELLGEIIKNDPWLLDKVMSRIRDYRAQSNGSYAVNPSKGDDKTPKK